MVAKDVLTVTSKLPVSSTATVVDSVRKSWLQENYVNIVAQVLEEVPRSVATTWTFSPMVKVESLPEGERAEATRMYAAVHVAAAREIEAVVEKELSSMLVQFPQSLPPDAHTQLRSAWLVQNYISIVSRVLKAQSQTTAGSVGWTFTPAVPIEAVPCEKKGRALAAYAEYFFRCSRPSGRPSGRC